VAVFGKTFLSVLMVYRELLDVSAFVLSASREDCSVEQPKDGDDTYRSRKTTDFVLWHGLSSKSSGSLDSLIVSQDSSTQFVIVIVNSRFLQYPQKLIHKQNR